MSANKNVKRGMIQNHMYDFMFRAGRILVKFLFVITDFIIHITVLCVVFRAMYVVYQSRSNLVAYSFPFYD